jgi:hypothetical protein
MATTTNYGWTTPDDTALVKDGAAAIRTLGSSVDTTTKNLNPETTLGDLAYRSSTANVKTRLGLGTAGQVLAVNSGANAPEWKTISSGGMTLISTTTLTGASTVLSSIPQTYKHLLLILKNFRGSVNGEDSFLKLNNTAVTLMVVGAKRTGGSTSVFHRENEIQISNSQGNGFTAYETSAAIWFYDYTSTTGGKAISSCSAFLDFSGNTCAISTSGGHTANDTTAITSLGFNYGSGNIASGTALLYGVN